MSDRFQILLSNLKPVMSSSHTTLDAASASRKARLAGLAALKRKQNEADTTAPVNANVEMDKPSTDDSTPSFISGRNYNWETKGARLGFEHDPAGDIITLEHQASEIAASTAEAAQANEDAEKVIDLFNLQPKNPNWDLKRDLEAKMNILGVKTENAIAKLVRQRIQDSQRNIAASATASTAAADGEHERMDVDGEMLLQGVHAMERENA
ncbi:hypothetical protein FQN57_000911 [Myotisia sp. PD_48]|nr:hypothetical protein FQN57_000911 [Myotisia sp. PD_48]